MNAVTITVLIFDSRLINDRRTMSEVSFTPVREEGAKFPNRITQFFTLGRDYQSSMPERVELLPGLWMLEFTSIFGSKVGRSILVGGLADTFTFDAAMFDVYDGSGENFTLNTSNYLSVQEGYSNPTRLETRSLVPSRGGVRVDAKRNSNSYDHHEWPIAFIEEYAYSEGTQPTTRQQSFKYLQTFDEKLKYWMHDWQCLSRSEDLKFEIGSKTNSSLRTARIRINIGDREKSYMPIRFVLIIRFDDEDYRLMLPAGRNASSISPNLDVEVDYFDSSQKNSRIISTRILSSEPAFNGIAQMLGAGNLHNARNLWAHNALDLLSQKYADPISAIAGALLIVQPDILGNKEIISEFDLETWLMNLYIDFPWASEGAICLAWFAASGKNPFTKCPITDDIEVVRLVSKLLMEAADRGPPIYMEGLRLLNQGFDWASDYTGYDKKDAVQWLSRVSVKTGPFLMLRNRRSESL